MPMLPVIITYLPGINFPNSDFATTYKIHGSLFFSRMKATSEMLKTPKPVTSDDANVVRLMSCDAPTPD
jgi:hypothetical protein